MDPIDNIALDLFYKIRSRFSGLKLGQQDGTITIQPETSRFFEFEYKDGVKPLGHVTISIAEPNSMKVFFSANITDEMNPLQKKKWYDFLLQLRQFAKRRLMAFDTRDIIKSNLEKRDYEFLAKNSKKHSHGEEIMKESMYGSRTRSYQKLLDTRLIVKHSKRLDDDVRPQGRARNISAIFIESPNGERFKYPYNYLSGARAMQRHIANHGNPYDDIGRSIIGMNEELAALKAFSRNYLPENIDQVPEVVNSIFGRVDELKKQIKSLSTQSKYKKYSENFCVQADLALDEDTLAAVKEQLAVTEDNDAITAALPYIYKIMMKEHQVLGYDELLELVDVDQDEEDSEEVDGPVHEFNQFEDWVTTLGEGEEIEDQAAALNDVFADPVAFGPDGVNARMSIADIINDPDLDTALKDAARENPEADARQFIVDWLKEYNADLGDLIKFEDAGTDLDSSKDNVNTDTEDSNSEFEIAEPGDKENKQTAEESVEDASAYAVYDRSTGEEVKSFDSLEQAVEFYTQLGPDERTQYKVVELEAPSKKDNQFDVKELAEFIYSFYDKNSGSFPKGPSGVCVIVGKKFGDHAEQAARQMVLRLAPHQHTDQDSSDDSELDRIKSLSGMPSGRDNGNDVEPANDANQNVEIEINVEPDVDMIRKLSGI